MRKSSVCGSAGLGLLALLLLGTAAPAWAGPLTAGDFLVSDSNQHAIYECNPDGRRVQTISVPLTPDRYNRGITVNDAGQIQVYNGTLTPTLSTYDPTSSAWVHHSFPGWSTVGSLYFGGVAAYRDFVYATSASTSKGDEPNGIVRFNRVTYAAERFANGLDFGYVTLGRDGLLYGLAGVESPAGRMVYVFNPRTMAMLRMVALPVDTRGIAVDEAGHIFAPGALMDRNLYEFDANGKILTHLNTGMRFMNDIALSANGQLVVGAANGGIALLTDVSLSDSRPYFTGGGANFVAWVPEPVTEPASLTLMAVGALCLLAYGRDCAVKVRIPAPRKRTSQTRLSC